MKSAANFHQHFQISETNESALKDWAPMKNPTLTKLSSEPKHGQAAVYQKKKGDAYKIIVTLPDPKFEIVVERRIIKLDAKGKEVGMMTKIGILFY